MTGLVFTFGLGLFILIGAIIVFVTKNNDKFVEFSISVAFGVMATLLIGELIPETLELFHTRYEFEKSILLLIICILIGISILKLLDFFIPDHDMEEENEKEHKEQLKHIGLVSSVALVLHNVIEGMAIYSTVSKSLHLGFLVSLGVGLHNIPLGMVITSTFYKSNNDKKKTLLLVGGISLSTFLGGLIMYFLAGKLISDTILAILLGITSGMLVYIVLFELLPHMIHSENKKTTCLGVLLGVMLLVLSFFFHSH